jgi:LysR family transcriptional activator of mexEF-oprN operon
MQAINERDFRGFDLNLLLVLSALLKERNVTRAAARLFVGQPALSAALKRLRSTFGDELFVRTGQGMKPTPRALELGATLGPLLQALQGTLHQSPAFDPATSERVFRVGLSDSLEVALVPPLLQRLSQRAPGVRLISRMTDGYRAAELLDAGEIELAIGVPHKVAPWQRQLPLFEWAFLCLFDPRHVRLRGKRISMPEYLRYPHVLTSFSASLSGVIDERLQERGLTRRVLFSSGHFATTPMVLRQMPALATMPSFIANIWRDTAGLSTSPVPLPLPSHPVAAWWARANDGDPGLQWLIGEVTEVCRPTPHA